MTFFLFTRTHFRWAIMKIPLKNSGSCTTSWSRILCRRYYNLTVPDSFCFSSTPFYSILSSSEIIWTCWIDTRQCTLWRGFWGWLKSLWSSTSIGYFNLPYLYSFLGVSIFQHFGTNTLSFAFSSTFRGIFLGFFSSLPLSDNLTNFPLWPITWYLMLRALWPTTNNGSELNFTALALLRFPFGFDGDDQAERHEDLVRYLQVFVQSKGQ